MSIEEISKRLFGSASAEDIEKTKKAVKAYVSRYGGAVTNVVTGTVRK